MATTQVEQDNATQVRRGFNAFSIGDMAALTELFTPDATWHGPATGVITGDYVGREDIFKMFGQLGEETLGTFRASPGAFAAAGDDVFVQVLATGRRNGKSLESDEVMIFTLNDGKVTRVRFYLSGFQANLDFWS
jgi:ketosteroid isomerase-like protein